MKISGHSNTNDENFECACTWHFLTAGENCLVVGSVKECCLRPDGVVDWVFEGTGKYAPCFSDDVA